MNPNKPVFRIFPDSKEAIDKKICPTCNKPVGEFKDELSKKEYEISGCCQKCQDDLFGE